MAYMALYRKYRPNRFAEVIGQPQIVTTLKNQLRTGRTSHAYLFCGTRGTGKTSLAKIFAKALNCLSPEDGEPCGSCASCIAVSTESSANVLEMDAASNNGVDNIRDLRDAVRFSPAEGKYKVHIIDEVHMLSTGAFNALLKTLEEPPEYVVFILATTDPQKIPATIHSRCQRFDFRRIEAGEMTAKLSEYAQNEKIDIDSAALSAIARLSDGAMRDALSLLDQSAIFFTDTQIKENHILELTGAASDDVYFKLTDAIISRNSQDCLNIIENALSSGRDIARMVGGLIAHFRNLLVAGIVTDSSSILDLSGQNAQMLQTQAQNADATLLMNYIEALAMLQNQLKLAPNPRLLLEVQLLKFCTAQGSGDVYGELVARIQNLEQQLASGVIAAPPPKAAAKKKLNQ